MQTTRHRLQVQTVTLEDVCLELIHQVIGIRQVDGGMSASVSMELVEASASTTQALIADFVQAVLIAIETQGTLPTSVDPGNTNVMVQAEEMRAWAWIGFPDNQDSKIACISLTSLETTITEEGIMVMANVDVTWSEES